MKLPLFIFLFILLYTIPAFVFSDNNQINTSNGIKACLAHINTYGDKKSSKGSNRFTFLAFGSLNFGTVSYYPFQPVEGDYTQYTNAFGPNSPKPYDFSYSYGLGMDFLITKNIALFLEGSINSWKLLLAKENEYSYGQWVAEATNYNTAVVGPFTMDTYYYTNSTNLRLGLRYIIPFNRIQPWIGGGVILSSWNSTIGNRKLDLKIGTQDSGLAYGISFSGGIDILFSSLIIRIYTEYGSPIANPEISGLLKDPYSSASFKNTQGEYTTAPYKIGVAIGIR